MAKISIGFSRYSAFYSPLITTIACGFLKDEGLDPEYHVATADRSAFAMIADGTVDVTQSAVSASWAPLEQGKTPPVMHFAQINLLDGFFIVAKEPDPDFNWGKLKGAKMIVDHGGQPMAMFRYACYKAGVEFDSIEAIDLGGSDAMEAGFRAGRADYAHFQGPTPQQLEVDGVGHVVASVGEAIGPVAFSSLAASPEWLETDMAKAFMRAYRKARQFCIDTQAAEIAKIEDGYFAGIGQPALTTTIEAYQKLGNWHPSVEISRESYEAALDVFAHRGAITKRHPYAQVVSPPPDA
jgi:NitT/TauT family transport system substrate-binding protein